VFSALIVKRTDNRYIMNVFFKLVIARFLLNILRKVTWKL